MTDPKKPKHPAVSVPAGTDPKAEPPKVEPAPVVDIGALLYRDKATEPRDTTVTEGKANFATQTAEAHKSVHGDTPPEAA